MKNLDVLNFTRRLRQHGIALNFIMKSSEMKTASRISNKRPIEYIGTEGKDIWFENEVLGMKDKLRIYFYKKFLEIQMREKNLSNLL